MRRSEHPAKSYAGAEVILVAVVETVAVVGPASVDEHAKLLRLQAILKAQAGVAKAPCLTVAGNSAANIEVRRDARFLDRPAPDETAAVVVNACVIIAERCVLLRVNPRGVNADAEVVIEEVIEPDTAAPAVVPNRARVEGAVAVDV